MGPSREDVDHRKWLMPRLMLRGRQGSSDRIQHVFIRRPESDTPCNVTLSVWFNVRGELIVLRRDLMENASPEMARRNVTEASAVLNNILLLVRASQANKTPRTPYHSMHGRGN
ncbi:hypothetical protein RRG08_001731 [Elysia crispata]|uniref:Uncharacterized protein n=1 Tax=Elysia crispata TaxID=231223 RepID=A0AAE1E1F0_9GAST|nr:hypothetical protein RRG08_001731 [Elysia crispata]